MSKVKVFAPVKRGKDFKKKLRVCAYARVSTDKAAQKDSYENQVKYFSEKIKNNPDYEYVGVFADEAITGTTDNRPNFQRMVAMAESGKIDLILTKSISRFSRNVGDLTTYCNKMRNHNVNIIFEEEKIELASSSGGLLLTILGAIAQMEVQNTSEHVKWVLQKKMGEGKLVGSPNPFGYDVVDGKLVINEEEASHVRDIFRWYLEGIGCVEIARRLEAQGIKTKRMKSSRWYIATINNILKNEKYKGDLIQGKTYTVNPIGHIRKRNITKENENEAFFYEDKNHHEAIISEEDFDRVQEIMSGRRIQYKNGITRGTTKNSTQSDFTSKIVCAYCGKNFVRRKSHPNSKYEKAIWKCTSVCKGHKLDCPKSVALDENFIKSTIVGIIKDLIDDRSSLFYLSDEKLNSLLKKSESKKGGLEKQIGNTEKNIQKIEEKKSVLLDMYAEGKISDKEYNEKRIQYENESEKSRKLLDDMMSMIQKEDNINVSCKKIKQLIKEGKAEAYNKELFDLLIDKLVVGGTSYREDGIVDDPRSIHYELKIDSLDTDLKISKTEDGEVKYGPIENMENNCEKSVNNEDIGLYTLDKTDMFRARQ